MRAPANGHALALSLIACLAAASAGAQPLESGAEAVSPEAFLEDVEGKTVHYTLGGEYYGSERFYGKGRATWQFPGDNCEDGVYWSDAEEICFRYASPSPGSTMRRFAVTVRQSAKIAIMPPVRMC